MRQSPKVLLESRLTPENKLWRAVLEQAYIDAELWADCADNGDGPAERIRARHYLRGDGTQESANLALVCDFAAIPGDRVVTWARKKYPQLQRSPAAHLKSQHAQYRQQAFLRKSHASQTPRLSA